MNVQKYLNLWRIYASAYEKCNGIPNTIGGNISAESRPISASTANIDQQLLFLPLQNTTIVPLSPPYGDTITYFMDCTGLDKTGAGYHDYQYLGCDSGEFPPHL
nr:hypothetical protein [Bacteroidota bacterium]